VRVQDGPSGRRGTEKMVNGPTKGGSLTLLEHREGKKGATPKRGKRYQLGKKGSILKGGGGTGS